MTPCTKKKIDKSLFLTIRKTVVILVLSAFTSTSVQVPAYAQVSSMPWMPKPGVMVSLSPPFNPANLKGMIIHPENSLQFDFIINRGDDLLSEDQKKDEYNKLIKYFLASLATPDDDQWVNLSPYEKDRIIKDDFGKTEMGRDVLAQDYILKQITSSLIYPESKLGQKFWDKVYAEAQQRFGTTNVPMNTFNKVWIVPDEAVVYEKGNVVYLEKSHLKVMLEEDYLSLAKHNGIEAITKNPKDTHALGSQIVRQIVLPELEKEINEGKNFASLRQIFSGVILAVWYKKALKESLLGKIYANKSKVKGVDQDPQSNEIIYQNYLKAFKKGVFNYIKEDVDKYTNQSIPRKYFSGGLKLTDLSAAMKVYEGIAPSFNAAMAKDDNDVVSAAMRTDKEAPRPSPSLGGSLKKIEKPQPKPSGASAAMTVEEKRQALTWLRDRLDEEKNLWGFQYIPAGLGLLDIPYLKLIDSMQEANAVRSQLSLDRREMFREIVKGGVILPGETKPTRLVIVDEEHNHGFGVKFLGWDLRHFNFRINDQRKLAIGLRDKIDAELKALPSAAMKAGWSILNIRTFERMVLKSLETFQQISAEAGFISVNNREGVNQLLASIKSNLDLIVSSQDPEASIRTIIKQLDSFVEKGATDHNFTRDLATFDEQLQQLITHIPKVKISDSDLKFVSLAGSSRTDIPLHWVKDLNDYLKEFYAPVAKGGVKAALVIVALKDLKKALDSGKELQDSGEELQSKESLVRDDIISALGMQAMDERQKEILKVSINEDGSIKPLNEIIDNSAAMSSIGFDIAGVVRQIKQEQNLATSDIPAGLLVRLGSDQLIANAGGDTNHFYVTSNDISKLTSAVNDTVLEDERDDSSQLLISSYNAWKLSLMPLSTMARVVEDVTRIYEETGNINTVKDRLGNAEDKAAFDDLLPFFRFNGLPFRVTNKDVKRYFLGLSFKSEDPNSVFSKYIVSLSINNHSVSTARGVLQNEVTKLAKGEISQINSENVIDATVDLIPAGRWIDVPKKVLIVTEPLRQRIDQLRTELGFPTEIIPPGNIRILDRIGSSLQEILKDRSKTSAEVITLLNGVIGRWDLLKVNSFKGDRIVEKLEQMHADLEDLKKALSSAAMNSDLARESLNTKTVEANILITKVAAENPTAHDVAGIWHDAVQRVDDWVLKNDPHVSVKADRIRTELALAVKKDQDWPMMRAFIARPGNASIGIVLDMDRRDSPRNIPLKIFDIMAAQDAQSVTRFLESIKNSGHDLLREASIDDAVGRDKVIDLILTAIAKTSVSAAMVTITPKDVQDFFGAVLQSDITKGLNDKDKIFWNAKIAQIGSAKINSPLYKAARKTLSLVWGKITSTEEQKRTHSIGNFIDLAKALSPQTMLATITDIYFEPDVIEAVLQGKVLAETSNKQAPEVASLLEAQDTAVHYLSSFANQRSSFGVQTSYEDRIRQSSDLRTLEATLESIVKDLQNERLRSEKLNVERVLRISLTIQDLDTLISRFPQEGGFFTSRWFVVGTLITVTALITGIFLSDNSTSNKAVPPVALEAPWEMPAIKQIDVFINASKDLEMLNKLLLERVSAGDKQRIWENKAFKEEFLSKLMSYFIQQVLQTGVNNNADIREENWEVFEKARDLIREIRDDEKIQYDQRGLEEIERRLKEKVDSVLKPAKQLKVTPKEEKPTGPSMIASNEASAESVANGGIDLNAAMLNMQIKRDGKGVPLPFSQQDLKALDQIEGLIPEILKIQPATSFPLLSQLAGASQVSSS